MIGEVIGRFVNDWIQTTSIRRSGGFFEAESRLWCVHMNMHTAKVRMTIGYQGVLFGNATVPMWIFGTWSGDSAFEPCGCDFGLGHLGGSSDDQYRRDL